MVVMALVAIVMLRVGRSLAVPGTVMVPSPGGTVVGGVVVGGVVVGVVVGGGVVGVVLVLRVVVVQGRQVPLMRARASMVYLVLGVGLLMVAVVLVVGGCHW